MSYESQDLSCLFSVLVKLPEGFDLRAPYGTVKVGLRDSDGTERVYGLCTRNKFAKAVQYVLPVSPVPGRVRLYEDFRSCDGRFDIAVSKETHDSVLADLEQEHRGRGYNVLYRNCVTYAFYLARRHEIPVLCTLEMPLIKTPERLLALLSGSLEQQGVREPGEYGKTGGYCDQGEPEPQARSARFWQRGPGAGDDAQPFQHGF